MKPLGVDMLMTASGPSLRVTKSSRAEDAIWEAAEEAIAEGITPDQFIRMVREAWSHCREEQRQADDAAFRGVQL